MWGTSLERCSYGLFVIDWSVSWISLNPWQFTFAWCRSVHPRSIRPQGNHRSGPPFLQWARSVGWPPWRAVSLVVWSGRALQASGRCPGRPSWVGPQCWPSRAAARRWPFGSPTHRTVRLGVDDLLDLSLIWNNDLLLRSWRVPKGELAVAPLVTQRKL